MIAYGSLSLNAAQRKYCTTRKELMALVRFTREYRHYLLGRRFVVRTDHNSLLWLTRFRYIEGQLVRWLEELSQYDMDIIHRPGKKHQNADGLSRIPDEEKFCECYRQGFDINQLPCGGCRYCSRAHNQWARFEEDVDDVIPLSVRSVAQNSTADDTDDSDSEDGDEQGEWFGGYSWDELMAKQKKDPDIGPVILWLEGSGKPNPGELELHSPSVKHLWLCKTQLVIENGVLHYIWEDVVPRRGFVVP